MAQQPVTVSTLELGPTSEEDKEEGRAYSTRSTYTDILDFHVVPKWGKKKLLEVRRADFYWTFFWPSQVKLLLIGPKVITAMSS
jgi:hypothetical protein